MFKRILVSLDGSEGAERAIPFAARLVRAYDDDTRALGIVTRSGWAV